MAEEITQEMVDKLADIYWWIRGYKMSDGCVFEREHLEALRVARVKLMNLMELKKSGEKNGKS